MWYHCSRYRECAGSVGNVLMRIRIWFARFKTHLVRPLPAQKCCLSKKSFMWLEFFISVFKNCCIFHGSACSFSINFLMKWWRFLSPGPLFRLCRVRGVDSDKRSRIFITINISFVFLGCLAVVFGFYSCSALFRIFIFIFRRMAASRLLRSASLLPAREESGKLSSSSRFDSSVLSEFKTKLFWQQG